MVLGISKHRDRVMKDQSGSPAVSETMLGSNANISFRNVKLTETCLLFLGKLK